MRRASSRDTGARSVTYVNIAVHLIWTSITKEIIIIVAIYVLVQANAGQGVLTAPLFPVAPTSSQRIKGNATSPVIERANKQDSPMLRVAICSANKKEKWYHSNHALQPHTHTHTHTATTPSPPLSYDTFKSCQSPPQAGAHSGDAPDEASQDAQTAD